MHIKTAAFLFCTSFSMHHVSAVSLDVAKNYVQDLGTRAINTLTNSTLPDAQIGPAFRKLLDEGFAVPEIGKFVLGRHWRQASEQQQTKFIGIFKTRLEHSYAARFREYKGVKFAVKEGRVEGDNGVIVNSTIQKPGGPIIHVDWKIYDTAGNPKIYDVIVDGVSMSITLRSEYASILGKSGSNIDAFLTTLAAK